MLDVSCSLCAVVSTGFAPAPPPIDPPAPPETTPPPEEAEEDPDEFSRKLALSFLIFSIALEKSLKEIFWLLLSSFLIE